jgi:hypothetical protein
MKREEILKVVVLEAALEGEYITETVFDRRLFEWAPNFFQLRYFDNIDKLRIELINGETITVDHGGIEDWKTLNDLIITLCKLHQR